MKTPKEAGYPLPIDYLERTKKYLEECVNFKKFINLDGSKITQSPELTEWLKKYGWVLDVSYGQRDEEYYQLKPLELKIIKK